MKKPPHRDGVAFCVSPRRYAAAMSETPQYRTAPLKTDALPPGIGYIVGNEAAERFSYYGMRAILVAFMTKHLLDASGQPDTLGPERAKEVFHDFSTAVYFFPIVGAIAADWLFGKYRVIVGLSLLYCVGHGILALMDAPHLVGAEPRTLLYLGLGCIAVGAGGIKPCVSAHVGDQFGSGNAHLLDRVFAWFYFSINLGATVSTLLTPVLLDRYGAGWAFGVPGVLMALATLVFWLGRHSFAHVPPGRDRFVAAMTSREGWHSILRLLPALGFFIAFWMLFDQTSSAWVIQAEAMRGELPVSLPLFGDELLPSQLQAINPVLVMLFIPLFNYGLYPLAGRLVTVTPLRKIGVGLALVGLSFVVAGWIEQMIAATPEGEPPPHRMWQAVPYLLITAAEILVSITGLEFAYSQSPKTMKSIVMGLFFLTIAAANFIVARINGYIDAAHKAGDTDFLTGESYYYLFAVIAAASSVGFILWSLTYRYQTHLQGDAIEE